MQWAVSVVTRRTKIIMFNAQTLGIMLGITCRRATISLATTYIQMIADTNPNRANTCNVCVCVCVRACVCVCISKSVRREIY